MSRYTLSVRTTITTANAAFAEIRTGSSRVARVQSIECISVSNTASVIGIGRPAAIGVTPTTQVLFLPLDAADVASTTNLATAWTTPPTIPTQFFRRADTFARSNSAVRFTSLDRGWVIPVSSALVLWNLAAGAASTFDLQVELEE